MLSFPFVACPSLPTSLQQGSGFQGCSINDPSALELPSHSHVTVCTWQKSTVRGTTERCELAIAPFTRLYPHMVVVARMQL